MSFIIVFYFFHLSAAAPSLAVPADLLGLVYAFEAATSYLLMECNPQSVHFLPFFLPFCQFPILLVMQQLHGLHLRRVGPHDLPQMTAFKRQLLHASIILLGAQLLK